MHCACAIRQYVGNSDNVTQWVQWFSGSLSIGLVTESLRVRLTPGPLQATLSKLLTYCVLRATQPPTLSGTGNK